MEKALKITVMLLIMAAMVGLVACNGGSSTPGTNYSLETDNNNSSSNYPEEETNRDSEQNSTSKKNNNESIGNELARIVNTNWEFTDAVGTDFVLKVKDIARDGKSVKAEVIRNGETFYVSIEAEYDGWGENKEFKCYKIEVPVSDHIEIYYHAPQDKWDYGSMNYSQWDYNNGYIYNDFRSFNIESPKDRVSIKKKR